MLAGAIVIGLLILLVLVIIFAIDYNKKGKFDLGVIFGLILSILISIEVVLLSAILEDPKPMAIDVYRGKTTLEYTIRDGVKIDSVVVWKGDIDNED